MPHPSDSNYVQKMAKRWQQDHPVPKYQDIPGYGFCATIILPPLDMYRIWSDEKADYCSAKHFRKFGIDVFNIDVTI
jgi:hypothetical protein